MTQPTSRLWKRLASAQNDWGRHIPYRGVTKKADSCEECGIWPFTTGLDDPFLDCCKWHDRMYTLKETGELPPDWTRVKVDCGFFGCMAVKCRMEHDEAKRAEMYQRMAYYIITVNELGGLFW